MDFFPTILNLADIPYSKAIDRNSLDQILLYNKPLEPRIVFWQHGNRYAARKGQWKLIIPDAESRPELYNLQNDIGEKNNVAEVHPELVEELISALVRWKTEDSKGVKKSHK